MAQGRPRLYHWEQWFMSADKTTIVLRKGTHYRDRMSAAASAFQWARKSGFRVHTHSPEPYEYLEVTICDY